MKILVLCAYGQNRSRYLAEYLATKGFETDFDGVKNDEEAVQAKINWAETIIAVTHDIHERALVDFDFKGKKLFALDVDDRPEKLLPAGKVLTGDDWVNFQERYVYPKLIEQANKALKIE